MKTRNSAYEKSQLGGHTLCETIPKDRIGLCWHSYSSSLTVKQDPRLDSSLTIFKILLECFSSVRVYVLAPAAANEGG